MVIHLQTPSLIDHRSSPAIRQCLVSISHQVWRTSASQNINRMCQLRNQWTQHWWKHLRVGKKKRAKSDSPTTSRMTNLFGSTRVCLGTKMMMMMMMIREQTSCSGRLFGRTASSSRSIWSAGRLELRASGLITSLTGRRPLFFKSLLLYMQP